MIKGPVDAPRAAATFIAACATVIHRDQSQVPNHALLSKEIITPRGYRTTD